MSKSTKSIEINIEVSRAIEAARMSFDETENDILQRLLGIDSIDMGTAIHSDQNGWKSKTGVFLPNGTELTMTYNNQDYTGYVTNGYIVADRKRFTSLSSAATHVSGKNLNGWRYWQARFPDSNQLVPLDRLRRRAKMAKALVE